MEEENIEILLIEQYYKNHQSNVNRLKKKIKIHDAMGRKYDILNKIDDYAL